MSARKTERLLNLVICLLATRRYLSAEQIRQTVAGYEDLGDEAFKRKFERDKEDLRDLGIPLETGSDSVFDDEPGYRIRRDDYSLPDIAFEPAELAVLGVAARTWQQASLGGQAFEAVLKLRAAGVDIDDAVPVAIETRVSTSEPAFEPLRRAATDRRPVEFDYRRPGARRHVEPWGLVSWHGRWYLVARDADRGEPRVFRHRPHRGSGRPWSVRPAVCRCLRAPTSAPSCVAWTPPATVSPRRCAFVLVPHSGCGGARVVRRPASMPAGTS